MEGPNVAFRLRNSMYQMKSEIRCIKSKMGKDGVKEGLKGDLGPSPESMPTI